MQAEFTLASLAQHFSSTRAAITTTKPILKTIFHTQTQQMITSDSSCHGENTSDHCTASTLFALTEASLEQTAWSSQFLQPVR